VVGAQVEILGKVVAPYTTALIGRVLEVVVEVVVEGKPEIPALLETPVAQVLLAHLIANP
jgi:hypothetical protein